MKVLPAFRLYGEGTWRSVRLAPSTKARANQNATSVRMLSAGKRILGLPTTWNNAMTLRAGIASEERVPPALPPCNEIRERDRRTKRISNE
jgi:hypothetical protein